MLTFIKNNFNLINERTRQLDKVRNEKRMYSSLVYINNYMKVCKRLKINHIIKRSTGGGPGKGIAEVLGKAAADAAKTKLEAETVKIAANIIKESSEGSIDNKPLSRSSSPVKDVKEKMGSHSPQPRPESPLTFQSIAEKHKIPLENITQTTSQKIDHVKITDKQDDQFVESISKKEGLNFAPYIIKSPDNYHKPIISITSNLRYSHPSTSSVAHVIPKINSINNDNNDVQSIPIIYIDINGVANVSISDHIPVQDVPIPPAMPPVPTNILVKPDNVAFTEKIKILGKSIIDVETSNENNNNYSLSFQNSPLLTPSLIPKNQQATENVGSDIPITPLFDVPTSTNNQLVVFNPLGIIKVSKFIENNPVYPIIYIDTLGVGILSTAEMAQFNVPMLSLSILQSVDINAFSQESINNKTNVTKQIKDLGPQDNNNLVPTDIKVLQEAEDKKLIVYDSIQEKDTSIYKSVAEVKLSPLGQKGYIAINPMFHNQVLRQIAINVKECTYEVALLNIDPITLIPLPSQTHLTVVIIRNSINNASEIVGLLTSENSDDTIKLSSTQPISDNIKKAQYIRPLKVPRSLEQGEYIINKKGTEYIQDPRLKDTLDDLIKDVIKFKSTPYDSVGITKECLLKIIEWHSQLSPPKLKKKSHEEIKKDLIKVEKAKIEMQKQKTNAEEMKKAKLSKIHENTKD